MEHFYGRNAGQMTFPQFLSALSGIGKVREELRPKTAEEAHAKAVAELTRQQARALRAKMEKARTGGS